MGLRPLRGRLLSEDDARSGAPVIVVSETFVQRVLDGALAVGRWVRLADGNQRWLGPVLMADGSQRWGIGEEAWYRIVGVAPDFPKVVSPYPPEPRVYQALPRSVASPVTMGIRLVGTESARFERRLQSMADDIDPLLRVESVSLGARVREGEASTRMVALVIAALALSVLLLAVAGLYALVSFTVTRRRRDIGIRSALGGQPERILGSILSGVRWASSPPKCCRRSKRQTAGLGGTRCGVARCETNLPCTPSTVKGRLGSPVEMKPRERDPRRTRGHASTRPARQREQTSTSGPRLLRSLHATQAPTRHGPRLVSSPYADQAQAVMEAPGSEASRGIAGRRRAWPSVLLRHHVTFA